MPIPAPHLRTALQLSNPLHADKIDLEGLSIPRICLYAHTLGTAESVTFHLGQDPNALPHMTPHDSTLYLESLARNMLSLQRVEKATAQLFQAGIRCAPLKGYAFLQDLYAHNVGARRMFDLDLLIDRPTFVEAQEILLQHGWTREIERPLISRINVESIFVHQHEGHTVRLELHRGLTFPGRFKICPQRLWQRASPHQNTWRLRTEDLLLYLAAHKAQHGYLNDCRDMVDATNLTQKHTINWDDLIAEAKRWGASSAAWLFFSRCQRAFGLTIPTHVLKRLAPPPKRQKRLENTLPDPTQLLDFRQCRNNQRPLVQKTATNLLLSDVPASELRALALVSLRNTADAMLSHTSLPTPWLQWLDTLKLPQI